MKTWMSGRGARHASLLAVMLMAPAMVLAQAVRSQHLELVPGWNAVYLEVDPLEPSPNLLFAGLPVDRVATFSASFQGSQFVNDPNADLQKAYGWAVWYAPSHADAFLSTLFAIQGGRPYLMHATTNVNVVLTGAIPPTGVRWMPNAYNFVGFPVEASGGPTFAQFFGPSPAHDHNRIYRLVEGTWRQVTDPAAMPMRSGEAFWIYTEGRSAYQGPLEVGLESLFGVELTTTVGSEVVFRNRTGHPLAVVIEHIVEGLDPIPMAIEVRTYDAELPGFRHVTVPLGRGAWQQSLPVLEAGKGLRLPLKLHSAFAESGPRHSLLRVRTDLGTVSYIPVTAIRDARASTTQTP